MRTKSTVRPLLLAFALLIGAATQADGLVQNRSSTLSFVFDSTQKVPRKVQTALMILETVDPPISYCYEFFNDFRDGDRGTSTGSVRVFRTDGTVESHALGGDVRRNQISDCAASGLGLEPGDLVTISGRNRRFPRGRLGQSAGLRLRIISGLDQPQFSTAPPEGRPAGVARRSSAKRMQPVRH